MDKKAKKFGLPVLVWIVIGIAIIGGVIMLSPIINQSILGEVKTSDDARATIQDISGDVDDLGSLLSDIDSSFG